MATQRAYIISGNSLEAITQSLNFHLQDVADRLDKLEAIRGTPTLTSDGLTVTGTHSHLDADGETIHSME